MHCQDWLLVALFLFVCLSDYFKWVNLSSKVDHIVPLNIRLLLKFSFKGSWVRSFSNEQNTADSTNRPRLLMRTGLIQRTAKVSVKRGHAFFTLFEFWKFFPIGTMIQQVYCCYLETCIIFKRAQQSSYVSGNESKVLKRKVVLNLNVSYINLMRGKISAGQNTQGAAWISFLSSPSALNSFSGL